MGSFKQYPWLLDILINIVAPWIVYHFAFDYLGGLAALLWSMLPPFLYSLVLFFYKRTWDFLNIFILVSMLVSLILGLLSDNEKVLLLRESLLSGLIGCVLLISVVVGKNILFFVAREVVARKDIRLKEQFTWNFKHNFMLRKFLNMICVVWGVGLVGETVLRVILAYRLPTETFLWVSPILGYAVMGILFGWTIYFRYQFAKRVR